jgi:predicted nucleic acid-binding protein
MSNVIKISNYSIKSDDNFFFDANIWILLFCPIASSRRKKQEIYAEFLEYIRSRKRPVHINALVLSEFINAWMHMSHKVWAKSQILGNTDYKRNFVGSEEYLEVVKIIQRTVDTVLSFCERNNDDFNSIEVPSIVHGLKNRDFNDNYYLQLANRKRMHIVSDDADLFDGNFQNILILTA